MVAMIWNSGCHSPALRFERDRGVRHEQAVDRRRRCEPVPRMPSVRQVSSTFTSGAFIGTPKCSTDRPPSLVEDRAGHQEVAGSARRR